MRNAEMVSYSVFGHLTELSLLKLHQLVDWKCCGEITLRSDLVGLIAQPINLGLSMFV